MYKPPSYKVGGTRTIETKSFGDHITADHVIIRRDKDSEIEESRLALVVKRKDIVLLARSCANHDIPVLAWVSLSCTGGSSWSHVNLTLPGNREKFVEAREKIVQLWASFVDMSDSVDKIGVQYAIEWLKQCVRWDWTRVKK